MCKLKEIESNANRYFIFAGSSYYPFGGARDLVSVVVHSERAMELARDIIGESLTAIIDDGLADEEDSFQEVKVDWSQVYDRVEQAVVAEFGSGSAWAVAV